MTSLLLRFGALEAHRGLRAFHSPALGQQPGTFAEHFAAKLFVLSLGLFNVRALFAPRITASGEQQIEVIAVTRLLITMTVLFRKDLLWVLG